MGEMDQRRRGKKRKEFGKRHEGKLSDLVNDTLAWGGEKRKAGGQRMSKKSKRDTPS